MVYDCAKITRKKMLGVVRIRINTFSLLSIFSVKSLSFIALKIPIRYKRLPLIELVVIELKP